jgi:hypothetical protein
MRIVMSAARANRIVRRIAAAEDGAVSVSILLVLAAVAALIYAVFGAATGDVDRYGRVAVPSTTALNLPKGSTDISYIEPDRGGGGGNLAVPRDLLVVVKPFGSEEPLELNSRGGDTATEGGERIQRIAEVRPSVAGGYEVQVRSKGAASRPNPQLAFGESPLSAFGDRISNVGDLITGRYGILAGVLLVGALVAPPVQRAVRRRS